MKHYEIKYRTNGKQYETSVYPTEGWESQYLQDVLYRIESIVRGGAVIIDVIEYYK